MATRRSNRKIHRGRRKKKGFSTWSTGKKVGVILLSIILVLVIGGGAAVAAYVTSKMDKIEVKELNAEALEINQEIERKEGYLNVALFGVDSRDASLGVGTRSDTIMVASLNQATGEIKVCSVYRDTLLQQSDGSYNKANAAYSFGGVEGAVALLNKNLDLDIEHYVTVNFDAMIDIIDALGGVEVEVTEDEAIYINGYAYEISNVTGRDYEDLPGDGVRLLDGIQATAYCRIRYTAGDDYKRTERQRLVLQLMVEKIQQSNLSTLNKIIDSVFDEIGTNFTLPEIISYAKDYKHYTLGETTGFPFSKGTATLSGIGSTVIPTDFTNDVVELHRFLYGEDGYTPSSTVNSIASGIAAKSGDVKTESSDQSVATTNNNANAGTNNTGGSTSNNTGRNTGGGTQSGGGNSGGGNTDDGGGSTPEPTPTPDPTPEPTPDPEPTPTPTPDSSTGGGETEGGSSAGAE